MKTRVKHIYFIFNNWILALNFNEEFKVFSVRNGVDTNSVLVDESFVFNSLILQLLREI